MPTISDAKFAALRALNYTGTVTDMTLQWLHAAGATSDNINVAWLEALRVQYPLAPNEYTNPELAGGAASPPGDMNPPTGHTIEFGTVPCAPYDIGLGYYGWDFNPAEASGRAYLAVPLALQPNSRYRVSVTVENLSAAATRAISLASTVDVTITAQEFNCPGFSRRVCYFEFTTGAAPTASFRVGTGTTAVRTERFKAWRPELYDLDALDAQAEGTRADLWFRWLGDQGYTGSISDRELAFWLDGGGPPLPTAPDITGAPGDVNVLEGTTGSRNYNEFNTGGAVASWAIAGNPAWLTLDPATGILTWTDVQAGSGAFTVTATNAAGSSQKVTNYTVGSAPGGDFVADFSLYPEGPVNSDPWQQMAGVAHPMLVTRDGVASTGAGDESQHGSVVIAAFPEAVGILAEVNNTDIGGGTMGVYVHGDGTDKGCGLRVFRWRTEFYNNNAYNGEVAVDQTTITSIGISNPGGSTYTFYINGEARGTRDQTHTGRQAGIYGTELDATQAGIKKVTIGEFTP